MEEMYDGNEWPTLPLVLLTRTPDAPDGNQSLEYSGNVSAQSQVNREKTFMTGKMTKRTGTGLMIMRRFRTGISKASNKMNGALFVTYSDYKLSKQLVNRRCYVDLQDT